MGENTSDKKKTIWSHLSGANAKIALLLAFVVGYSELMPVVKDFLGFNDDMEEIAAGCNYYTDTEIKKKQDEAEKYLDILTADVYKINKRYERDSIEYANNHKKFAVGFRADLNGILSYRNRRGIECSVRINHETGRFQFYSMRRDMWLDCFYEDIQ